MNNGLSLYIFHLFTVSYICKYAVVFVLNFILNLACFFMEFINLESNPAFAVLVTATVITVLIDVNLILSI